MMKQHGMKVNYILLFGLMALAHCIALTLFMKEV